MYRKCIAFIFTIVCSVLAQAEYTTSYKDFPSAAKQIPETLINAGHIKKIGNLNLKKIVKDIDEIKVVEKDWVETKVGDGNRIFARWEVHEDGPTVYLNKRSWNVVFNEYNHVLALHEVLGAMGYDDQNYDISLSMWVLANEAEKPVLDKRIRKNIKKQVEELSEKNSGGVIGVGGGGDLASLYVKINILRNAYTKIDNENSEQTQYDFFDSYRLIRAFALEVNWKVKE